MLVKELQMGRAICLGMSRTTSASGSHGGRVSKISGNIRETPKPFDAENGPKLLDADNVPKPLGADDVPFLKTVFGCDILGLVPREAASPAAVFEGAVAAAAVEGAVAAVDCADAAARMVSRPD
jgi:hypothetical protein